MPSQTLNIQESVLLAPFTTFGIGGPAQFFCEITAPEQLLDAVDFARKRNLPLFVLGGGSNLLVADSGFDGLVIHMAINTPVRSVSSGSLHEITAPAGLDWNTFVLQICEQEISGIECLAGIPGSIGGTPVQNVGAYGQEVAETIRTVSALDLETLNFVTLPRETCGFAYRRSIFNSTHRGRYIVTQVTFAFDGTAEPSLTYADLKKHFGATSTPTPLEVYHAVREIRRGKGMLLVEGDPDCHSAGSFFKNPIVPPTALAPIADALQIDPATIPHWPAPDNQIKLPAAWLLERAGFHKGFALGTAGISSRHTLALINRGHATASSIVLLRNQIQRDIKSRFNIDLEQEPVLLGF